MTEEENHDQKMRRLTSEIVEILVGADDADLMLQVLASIVASVIESGNGELEKRRSKAVFDRYLATALGEERP